MQRPLLALIILLLLSITLPPLLRHQPTSDVEVGSESVTLSGRTMGTTYNVTFIRENDAKIKPDRVHQAIETRLQEINQHMSTYIPNSEISRINKAPANTPIKISPDTAHVIAAAQQVSAATQGAFDITVGNLVNLWGFGPEIKLYAIPDETKIEAILAESGYQRLELDSALLQVRKHTDSLYLDLSGIAKGYAVDEIAELLTQHGFSNHLVEIGGEIRTGGEKRAGSPWNIGIERPRTKEHSVQRIIHSSTSLSMATSGDYRNYFEHSGKRYSHTIDPKTGHPINHNLAAISVLHTSCMLADAYATAFMVMGPQRSMDFATAHDISVYMLVKEEDGFAALSSPAFEKNFSSGERK
ncbi:MAG: FAD:protein FMN transferase [Desulfuromonadaceae bacterium]|nr:FAD:protein FMN transferase [Desulfuromonas sp.]MDY0185488.1 FAD:protein FMN transferase [Desulfuromonadaceae bacterium]